MPRRFLTLEEANELGAIKPLENSEIYMIKRDLLVDIYFREEGTRRLRYQESYPSQLLQLEQGK